MMIEINDTQVHDGGTGILMSAKWDFLDFLVSWRDSKGNKILGEYGNEIK